MSLLLIFAGCQTLTEESVVARKKLRTNGIKYSEQAFLEAVKGNNISVVKLFLHAGMDPDTKDDKGLTALMIACKNGYEKLADLLLQTGADVHNKCLYGNTPLHYASSFGTPSMITLLMKHGADINAQNCDGVTPLMKSVWGGRKEVVLKLLEYNPCITTTDYYSSDPGANETAINRARALGEDEILEILLKYKK